MMKKLLLMAALVVLAALLINRNQPREDGQARLNDLPVTDNAKAVASSDASQATAGVGEKTEAVSRQEQAAASRNEPDAPPSITSSLNPTPPDWRRLPDARILASKQEQADSEGVLKRTLLVESSLKYPKIRVVERFRVDNQGAEEVLESVSMIADHMIVRVRPGLAPEKVALVAKQNGLSIRKQMAAHDSYLVSIPDVTLDSLPEALASFEQEVNAVVYAEPDYVLFTTATAPNDTRYGQLWGLNQDNDADIDAPEAWGLNVGSSNVLVAVIDTGIDHSHEDLSANIWRNPGETPNGLDDDGNGFVDDLLGWDFYNNDSDPFDDHYHGTHCAGTIGAIGNNATGVVGVNWSVSLMALKFMGPEGVGASSDAIEAIYYATRRGVRLTSNSWGGGGYLQSMKEAIDDAGRSNILFIAAAGNSGRNNDAQPDYPAAYSSQNLIAVAATDSKDNLANFSNFGRDTVHLGAPGVGIISTVPSAQGKYASLSGTSMAAPHVAGAAALLYSYLPGLTAAQVKQRILENVDPIPTLNAISISGGRLNLYRTLSAVPPLQPPAVPTGLNATPSTNGMQLAWADVATNEASYLLERRSGSSGFDLIATLAADTTGTLDTNVFGGVTYTYRIKARNTAGDSAYSSEASATIPGAADAWDPADDASSGATSLNVGTNEASHGPHTLSGTDLYDWFAFPMQQGATYDLNAIGGSGDTYAELFADQNGTQLLISDDDSGGGLMFRIEYLSENAATNFLRVRSFDPGGDAAYYLKYSSIPASNRPPEIVITSPSSNALYQAPASIIIMASAIDPDGTITDVKFFNGATLLFTDTIAPYAYTWSGVAAGDYTVRAVATDDAGVAVTSAPVAIAVNAQPVVSLTSPTSGAVFVEGSAISVAATASDTDGSISQVTFYNGTELLQTDESTPYSFTWTNASIGSHAISAVASDDRGGIRSSSTSMVSVIAAQPVLSVSTTNINLQVVLGQNPANSSFTVANNGNGTLEYEISENIAWLSVSPTNGASAGGANTHMISYSTAGLATGTYSGMITISGNGAAGSPASIQVNLSVFADSLRSGLVAYYPFNGDVLDYSGFNNHGLLHNASFTNGTFDQALAFTGSHMSHVRVLKNASIEPQEAISIAFWCKSSTVEGYLQGTLLRKAAPWQSGYLIRSAPPSSRILTFLHFLTSGTRGYESIYGQVLAQEWVHIAASYAVADGCSRLYLNGQLIATNTYNAPLEHTSDLFIGGDGADAAGGGFWGVIDEVRIYNRALYSNEVWQLYGGGSASISGTISYSGLQTGQIVVVAGAYTNKIPAPGAFALTNLPIPRVYALSAFRDVNGNNKYDASEPYCEYAENPIILTNSLFGINLTLTDHNDVDFGLVAYYPFNGGGNDASGNGNHGTAQGVSFDPAGLSGGCARFDGINDYFIAPGSTASPTDSMTFSVWLYEETRKTSGDVAYANMIYSINQNVSAFGHNEVSLSGGVIWEAMSGGWFSTGIELPLKEWVHLAVVIDGKNLMIYHSGKLQYSNSINGINPIILPLNLGVWAQTLPTYGYDRGFFHGLMDEVRLYDRALSSNEIWQLYGGGSASISGTIDYSGSQTGRVVVRAGIYSATMTEYGSYTIDNLPAGSYSVFAFCDINDNGEHDVYEPSQFYSNNPVVISNNNVSVDIISFGDSDTDGDGLSDAFEAGYGRYEIITGSFTWDEASADAESRGGHLGTITSASEWSVIQQVIGENLNHKTLWLGGYDTNQEGAWSWVTDEQWGYTRWHSGEPNGAVIENHLQVNSLGQTPGSWSDQPSSSPHVEGYLFEAGWYTSPSDPDHDDDGLWDGDEANNHGTDPTRADTDGDGLNDGAEVDAGTNPLLEDSDSDGLSDYFEVVTKPCLDPLDADTDGDGASDADEEAAGSDPCSAHINLFSISGEISYDGSMTGTVIVTASSLSIPKNDLLAFYPFNGNADDESGNGHDGVVHGAALAPDRNGDALGAFQFSGNQWIDLGNAEGLNAASSIRSLMAWVKFDDLARDQEIISKSGISRGAELLLFNDPYDSQGFGLCGYLMGQEPGAPDFHLIHPVENFNTEDWFHVAIVYEGAFSNAYLYVNGLLVDSGVASSIWDSGDSLILGSWSESAYPRYFRGKIDDVMVFNRALSSNEVGLIVNPVSYVQRSDSPGNYQISNILSGVDYALSAFMDLDGNGVLDDGEPRGEYLVNPLYLTNNAADIDIELTVPLTGWTIRATHKLINYDNPGTNTVECEVFYPTNQSLFALDWAVGLPPRWSLKGARGDGDPVINANTAEILFSSSKLTNNPIRFTYDVSVPHDEKGPKEIGGSVSFFLSGQTTHLERRAEPDPLVVNPGNTYHSSDYREPKWVLDRQEVNRTLSYWRAGGCGVKLGTVDGYAPNEPSRNGRRHKADYQEPHWFIDGEEALRVIGYWMAGGYHLDPRGEDGFGPGLSSSGGLSIMDIADIAIASVAPATYRPGQQVTLRGSLSYSNEVLGLLWKPVLPPGWNILSVEANGGTPELVNNEILFTSKLPPSPLEIVYVCEIPEGMVGDALIQTDVQMVRQGSANPQSLLGLLSPSLLQLDTDGDGLPDWVETNTGMYRSPTDTGTDPLNADTDGDGVLDGQEVPAGTNPNEGSSVFQLQGLGLITDSLILSATETAPFRIQWSSVAGKSYYVVRSTNLVDGYSVIRSNILATPPLNTFIDSTPPEGQGIYSIGVE